jgi:isopentenyl-diphosphate Delta-isomerase
MISAPYQAIDNTGQTLRAPELLVVVDNQDREIGSLEKHQCHTGDGTLHRAFSVFIFNKNGELLIQQRSEQKPLWPLIWSNSCCSHPRISESIADASLRRIQEELGLNCELEYLYKFRYHARFDDVGSEREICSVFYGYYDGEIAADRNEISAWRYISLEELSLNMRETPNEFTPWFRMEWETIEKFHLEKLLQGCNKIQ